MSAPRVSQRDRRAIRLGIARRFRGRPARYRCTACGGEGHNAARCREPWRHLDARRPERSE